MGLTHLTVALRSAATVAELTARLCVARLPVRDGPRCTGDGYYESVVPDPEGNRVALAV